MSRRRKGEPRNRSGRSVGLAIVVALLLLAERQGWISLPRSGEAPGSASTAPVAAPDSGTPRDSGSDQIVRLFAEQRSDVVVELAAPVVRILPDDEKGSRHQRFLIEVAPGHTVLVAHNIDLAPRVPLTEGDRVELRGEYEWNEKGGVLHWTHHDPGGRRRGGWIELAGQRYE